MKSNQHNRRQFLKLAGLSAACVVLNSRCAWPGPLTLGQVRFRDSSVVLRLQISADRRPCELSASINVKNAVIRKARHYFFEPGEDTFSPETLTWTARLTPADADILVLWLDNATPDTNLEVRSQKGVFSFSLKQLLAAGQLNGSLAPAKITANFLFDAELGQIDPADAGIKADGDDFDFVIFADPQGGDPTDTTNDSPERVAIHNPFIEKNIALVNALPHTPAFTVIVGDIVDSKGQKSNYNVVLGFLEKLNNPVLFELGNHETPYSARFSPAYDMTALDNYFAAQKQINGLDKLAYSFDLGKWHFIVWPDPLRRDFWPTHPHYFDWLEEDLMRNHDRPTILLQHISLLPLGIDPMINYSEKIPVKRLLLDIITHYGNVKYVFSGHTHVPMKASFKTARTYKGVNFINLPPAGYRPRGFGEHDLDNEPSQGFALAHARGNELRVSFTNVKGSTRTYPGTFPLFRESDWPQWLTEDWQLPASESLINGSFEQGLTGWSRRFIYREDRDPSNICKPSTDAARPSSQSLQMYSRKRGAHLQGQDRLPQTINRISQAVTAKPGRAPLLSLAYKLQSDRFDPDRPAGALVRVQGFSGSASPFNLVYSVGTVIASPYGLNAGHTPFKHFDITAAADTWHRAQLNIATDFERTASASFIDLKLDKLVITLGTWTDNVDSKAEIGVYFDEIKLDFDSPTNAPQSTIDGKHVKIKDPKHIWNKSIVHIDGEHVYKDRLSN